MKVILISGKAGSGKDTAAGLMKEAFEKRGKRVLVTHYADLLKFICTNYFGWNGEKDEAGRKMLQTIGTDVVRKQNPDLWVDFVVTMLRIFHDNWDFVIIPDARFPNEVSNIEKEFDAVHVRVVRDDFDTALTDTQLKHISETALDNVVPDILLHNNGTMADLAECVENLMSKFVMEGKSNERI